MPSTSFFHLLNLVLKRLFILDFTASSFIGSTSGSRVRIEEDIGIVGQLALVEASDSLLYPSFWSNIQLLLLNSPLFKRTSRKNVAFLVHFNKGATNDGTLDDSISHNQHRGIPKRIKVHQCNQGFDSFQLYTQRPKIGITKPCNQQA